MIRTIHTDVITKNIKEMCIEANHYLSPDMKEALDKSFESEKSLLGKKILNQLKDNLKIAAFILFGDVEIAVRSASALLEKAPEYDILVTAEAKSIPLICEMARQAGDNDYIIARKAPKVITTNSLIFFKQNNFFTVIPL